MNLRSGPLFSGLRNHKEEAGIFTLWLLVNTLFLLKNGIVTTGEAAKYIHQAHQYVNTGHLESSNFWLYSVCIVLLSLCIRFQLHFGWLIGLQLLVNLCATIFFYKTTSRLLNSHAVAFIGTTLLLLNLPYQTYNTFLQTESLFQSFSLLLTCYMIGCKKILVPQMGVILISLVVLSVTRPNGLLYWPVASLFIFSKAQKEKSHLSGLAFAGLCLISFFFLLNTAMASGGELDFILPFREEHIICGVPGLSTDTKMPAPVGDNSIFGLLGYIFHHFGQFIRLTLLRSWSFWGLYRNYFSPLHNAYLMILFYPVTGAAVFSMPYWRKTQPLPMVCLVLPVLLTWTTVILTCDDWHNRIFISVSPFLLLLGLPLINRLRRDI